MHDCPDCGSACDCDGEDTWIDAHSDECVHECEPEPDDEAWDYEYNECTCDEDDQCAIHGLQRQHEELEALGQERLFPIEEATR
jgi:hypothetical protein